MNGTHRESSPDAIGAAAATDPRDRRPTRPNVGQIVLVLQGGGALGAYQAGVYQALHEAGIEPDWVIGTSIGAINGGLIAGNAPAERLARLQEFWRRIANVPILDIMGRLPWIGHLLPNWAAIAQGVNGFYQPSPFAFLGPYARANPGSVGYYSTQPLERTLVELIDFTRIAACTPRLTVGAANLGTGEMRYFDSRDTDLSVRHVMASGALPPAFSAIEIDSAFYWDGGILSNTPVEAVFDDQPRRNSLIFAVHVWDPQGPPPQSVWQVLSRQKEIQYASRALSHIARQKQIHHLRHIIAELAKRVAPAERDSDMVRMMESFGCLTQMHVVRLLAMRGEGQDHASDIDFSNATITTRWAAGYDDMRQVLAEAPWEREVDPLEGFHVHEVKRGI